MNQTITGTIGSVTQMVACDVLVTDAMTGTTVLQVGDVADFDEAGGHLAIDETVYAYTAIDDDTSTITLAAPLPVTHLTDSVVEVRLAAGDGTSYHRVVEYDVELAPIDGSTPITATLSHGLIPLVSADTRGLDGETAEAVRGEHEDAFEVTRIFGREATLNDETVGMPQLRPDVVVEIVSAQEAADQALTDAATAQATANGAATNAGAATALANDAAVIANAATAAAATADSKAVTAQNTANSRETPAGAQAKADLVAARERSKGTDLVTNGTGLLGSNYNFPGTAFSATDAPDGISGSFQADTPATITTTEDIPVDPARAYAGAFWTRQRAAGVVATTYVGLAPLDAYGLSILPSHYMARGGTTTTLAAALNPGDTVVKLASAANWKNNAAAATHWRTIIFWDYTDAGGKTWGPGTYSRNVYMDVYADGTVNSTTNEITLRAPWAGPTKPAGTPLSNGGSGGTYMYSIAANATVPETWTRMKSATPVTGTLAQPTTAGADPVTAVYAFPPGTARVRLVLLPNFNAVAASRHSYAGLSFSDVAFAGQTIDRWRTNGGTAINGQQVADDTITSPQIAPTAVGPKHTITGAVVQTEAAASRGMKMTSAGLVGYKPTGEPSFAYNAATGDVSILGTLRAGSKVIGSVFETSEVPNQGLKMGPTGLIGYDLGGVPTLAYDAVAGALTLKGTISSGSTIEGAEFKGAFALLGSLQVGAITIDDADGLNVPGAIHVPANGVDAVTLTAHATLKSATVEDNASLYGTTQLFGKLRAASGITPPTAAPTPAYSWPFTGTTDTEFGHIFRGLTDVPAGDKWASAYNFGGLGIQVTNKSDAAKFNWPVTGPNTESFSTGGGIVRLGSNYYILGQDWNRGANWYVYRVDASTFVKNAEWGFGVYADVPKTPAIGTDGSQILIAWSRPNGLLAVAEYSTSGTHARTNCILPAGSTAIDCGGVAMGTFDYSADTLLVATRAGQVYVSNPSSYVNATTPLTRLPTSEWTSANSTAVSGLVWDGTSFRHLDDAARTWQYSANRVSQSIDLAHAWYDGDAGGTGTHETQAGKKTTSSWKARSWLQVSTTPPPDAGNTDPLATDKADRVRVYAGLPAGTLRLQATLAVGVTLTALLSSLDVVSKAAETVNGFLSANSAAGQLESTTLDSGGKPKWWLRGDGEYKLPEAPFGSGFNTSALTAVSGTWYNFGSLTSQVLRGGMTYAATTGTYTVPRDGVYAVEIQSTWMGSASAGERAIMCTAGGVARYGYEGPSGTAPCQPKLAFKVWLAAGDTIATQVRQVSGANLALNVSSPGFNFVCVTYVGS